MQTVRERCYGLLVHDHREKAKKAAAAKRRPVEAKQQQLRQIEPRQPEGKPPQPMAKKARRQPGKERRQLRRQLPGLDSLLAFFRVAGVRVELVGGRRLWIDGAQTEPLAHLPPPETPQWNRLTPEEFSAGHRCAGGGEGADDQGAPAGGMSTWAITPAARRNTEGTHPVPSTKAWSRRSCSPAGRA